MRVFGNAARRGRSRAMAGVAAVWVAMGIAKQEAWRGKTIVTLLSGAGQRYLSTPLWEG